MFQKENKILREKVEELLSKGHIQASISRPSGVEWVWRGRFDGVHPHFHIFSLSKRHAFMKHESISPSFFFGSMFCA